jgi:hypothetical protein
MLWRQPVTRTYAVVLGANALWLHAANTRLDAAALRVASTNLDRLAHDPLAALVTSACWAEPGGLRAGAVLVAFLVAVAAPMEAWLGSARWLVAFAAGHVGATLVVAAGLVVAVHEGMVGASVSHQIDVGWSYGGLTLLALAAYRLPRRWAPWYAVALVAVRCVALVLHPSFTEWGHLVATSIGFGLGAAGLGPRRPAPAGEGHREGPARRRPIGGSAEHGGLGAADPG